MRINVYSEELTHDVQLVRKDNVIGEDGQPVTFFGGRLFLESSPKMHQTEHDDDRSAVTFWFREQSAVQVWELFARLADMAADVASREDVADVVEP